MPVYHGSQLLTPTGAGPGAVALRDERIVAVGPLREVLRALAGEGCVETLDDIRHGQTLLRIGRRGPTSHPRAERRKRTRPSAYVQSPR